MIEWALAAARAVGAGSPLTLRGVRFISPLRFTGQQLVTAQALVEDGANGPRVRCFAREDGAQGAWTEHVTALLNTEPAAPRQWQPAGSLTLAERDAAAIYAEFSERGLRYGPALRALRQLGCSGDYAQALIEADLTGDSTGDDDHGYVLHPLVLDACFHTAGAFLPPGTDTAWLPASVSEVSAYRRLGSRARCLVKWHGVSPDGECVLDLRITNQDGQLVADVHGLALRAASRAAIGAVTRPGTEGEGEHSAQPRGFAVAWHRRDRADAMPAQAASAGTGWLAVAMSAARAARWQAALAASPTSATAVTGSGQPDGLPALDPESAAGLRRLLAAGGQDGEGISRLILDFSDAREPDAREPAQDVPARAYQIVRHASQVLRNFLSERKGRRAEIIICSAGGVAAAPQDRQVQPEQAVLGALARSVIAEYPDVRCVHVDLDQAGAASPAEVLRAAASLAGSGHLALRGETCLLARLEETALPDPAQAPAVRSDASYLISGGLGGLGLATCGWLARHGARSILLAGRTVPGSEPPEITAIRAAGTAVAMLRADVSVPAQAQLAVDYPQAHGLPPLRGIVHAAGVTDDGPLTELSWPRFRGVLDAKVAGSWNLHQATAGLPLDFFVLFSSMASMVGSAGQASYATANSFMDALAQRRRQDGLPAVSISWGPWADTGMAYRRGLLGRLAGLGFGALPPDEALDLAGAALAGPAHIGLASVDWSRHARAVAGAHPDSLLAGLPGQDGMPMPRESKCDRGELARLAARDPAAGRDAVLGDLLDRVARLLGVSGQDRAALSAAFAGQRLSEAGLDSLAAVRLRDQLTADLGADVSPGQLLSQDTAADIADLICRQLAIQAVISTIDDEIDEDTEVFTL